MNDFARKAPSRAVPAGALLLFLWVWGEPATAHAYLDPATGSMIVSALVAVFATIVMAVKTYWHKLVGLFRGSGSGPEAEAAEQGGVVAEEESSRS